MLYDYGNLQNLMYNEMHILV